MTTVTALGAFLAVLPPFGDLCRGDRVVGRYACAVTNVRQFVNAEIGQPLRAAIFPTFADSTTRGAPVTDMMIDRHKSHAITLALSEASFDRDLMKRVAAVRSLVRGRIVFTTSFGLEGQAIAHAIFRQALEIEVVTLDTGRLFPETYELWAETERRYRRRIPAFYPDHVSVESRVARRASMGSSILSSADRPAAPSVKSRRFAGLLRAPPHGSPGFAQTSRTNAPA